MFGTSSGIFFVSYAEFYGSMFFCHRKKKITSQTFSFLDSELQDTNSSLHLNNKKKFTEVYIYILICSREKS